MQIEVYNEIEQLYRDATHKELVEFAWTKKYPLKQDLAKEVIIAALIDTQYLADYDAANLKLQIPVREKQFMLATKWDLFLKGFNSTFPSSMTSIYQSCNTIANKVSSAHNEDLRSEVLFPLRDSLDKQLLAQAKKHEEGILQGFIKPQYEPIFDIAYANFPEKWYAYAQDKTAHGSPDGWRLFSMDIKEFDSGYFPSTSALDEFFFGKWYTYLSRTKGYPVEHKHKNLVKEFEYFAKNFKKGIVSGEQVFGKMNVC